ncbi:hypothetical protein PL717_06870, partial [Bifidobacterium breve]
PSGVVHMTDDIKSGLLPFLNDFSSTSNLIDLEILFALSPNQSCSGEQGLDLRIRPDMKE